MKHAIFTLAPADHSYDLMELENGYKVWSTFKREEEAMYVRSNDENTGGGQIWEPIATRINNRWYVAGGRGYFAQGGALLARWLIDLGLGVRSKTKAYGGMGGVKYYKASAKVYSLPSLLNGGKAVVSRDKMADERRKAQRVDIAAAMAARKGV